MKTKPRQGGAAASTELPPLDESIKLLKKRAYFREKQREHRMRERSEEAHLIRRLAELEEQIRQAKLALPAPPPASLLETVTTSKGPLSWRDIAEALREDRDACIAQNRALKLQTFTSRRLLHDMHRMLEAAVAHPTHTSLRPSWRNVTLLANADARAMGKAWITQHMYHHMDGVFQTNFHPNFHSPDNFFDIDVEFSETCFHYVFYHQYTDHARSAAAIAAEYKQNLCAKLMVNGFAAAPTDTLREVSETTVLHQMTTAMGEAVNLLCGEFYDHSRRSTVLVAQHIHDDEAWQPNLKQRNITWWCRMHPAPRGGTRVQSIYRFSQCFSKDGFNSLENEARMVRLDLSQCPEEAKEARFRLLVLRWFQVYRDRFHVAAARSLAPAS